MTQDAVQFLWDASVRSGRARPACFTGRRVTPSHRVPSPIIWKRDDMKESQRDFSTGLKASLMLGVTRCTNVHS